MLDWDLGAQLLDFFGSISFHGIWQIPTKGKDAKDPDAYLQLCFFFPVLVPGDLKFYRKSSDFVPVVLVEVRCERADVLEVQETRDDVSLSLHQPK